MILFIKKENDNEAGALTLLLSVLQTLTASNHISVEMGPLGGVLALAHLGPTTIPRQTQLIEACWGPRRSSLTQH